MDCPLDRRAWRALFFVPWLAGAALAEAVPVRIVLFGDSYISSYGVDFDRKFKVQLETALNAGGPLVHVIDTGYTATTYSGLVRLPSLFAADSILGGTEPKAVILELGSNDCESSRKLEESHANLDAILKALADRHIPVLVAGTKAYDSCDRIIGPNYNARYTQMFAELADKYGDLYYRDFKDGVGDHPELMQGDRDHPTADGDAVIVARILPVVSALVARAQP